MSGGLQFMSKQKCPAAAGALAPHRHWPHHKCDGKPVGTSNIPRWMGPQRPFGSNQSPAFNKAPGYSTWCTFRID